MFHVKHSFHIAQVCNTHSVTETVCAADLPQALPSGARYECKKTDDTLPYKMFHVKQKKRRLVIRRILARSAPGFSDLTAPRRFPCNSRSAGPSYGRRIPFAPFRCADDRCSNRCRHNYRPPCDNSAPSYNHCNRNQTDRLPRQHIREVFYRFGADRKTNIGIDRDTGS